MVLQMKHQLYLHQTMVLLMNQWFCYCQTMISLMKHHYFHPQSMVFPETLDESVSPPSLHACPHLW